MNRSTAVLSAALAVCSLVIAGLGWTTWSLSSRVAALEMVAAQSLVRSGAARSGGGTTADDVAAIEQAVATWKEARAGEGGMTEDEAAALIEQTLEETLERKAEERETEKIDQYMKMAEESMRVEVEDLAKEYGLTDEQVGRTVDLLVQGMYEGQDLREDLKAGEITMREAKEEGEIIKREYEETLTEILGVEAYEALGRAFYGDGGWSAAK